MIFFSNKASMRSYLYIAAASLLANAISISAETTEQNNPPPPENWYQAEVVLFTHPTNKGKETEPQERQLTFTENWLQLQEPNQNTPILRLPVITERSIANYATNGTAKPSLEQLLSAVDTVKITQITQQVKQNPISNHIPEASIPYKYQTPVEVISSEIENIEDIQEDYTQPTTFVPIYEQPFVKLPRSERNLNDSARGLDRRGYNVLFHQAWRFQIDSKQQSPWVLIKAGSTGTDRYKIEGTLRFYKSRYLHFESDLWRLKFADNISNDDLILPQIPQQPISAQQALLLRAIGFSEGLATLMPADSRQADNLLFDPHKLYDLSSLKHLQSDNRMQPAENAPSGYPISEVWPVAQSKRLQQDEIYYIDHPEVGALITIKPYTPEPLNQPVVRAEAELENQDSQPL